MDARAIDVRVRGPSVAVDPHVYTKCKDAIGAVIAHEITHGYDDKGRKFDADGNINDWWTEDDAGLFTKYADIMGKSSEKYTFVDVEPEEKKELKHRNVMFTIHMRVY